MSDIKHTPGPWHVRDKHPGRSTFNIGTNPDEPYDGEVAVIFRSRSLADEQHLANARLIAAAPDMLMVLKKLASECCECLGGGLASVGGSCPDCEDIRAVIAKAEIAP